MLDLLDNINNTHTLIVGASLSGLASASSLQREGLDYIIIEKQSQLKTPWYNHYTRLHLHTEKSISGLPYKKFGNHISRYPSRHQVVEYLEDYQKKFNINPVYNTEAILINKEGEFWITETTNGLFKSKYIIVATGPYGKPKVINFKGMETFTGKILHSNRYKTGNDFKGQKVLVVGFGNSACEIALDLYEKGAKPVMSVRSPVNVLPRDIVGVPIKKMFYLLTPFTLRVADAIAKSICKLLYGDIIKLGLNKLPYGPLRQIQKGESSPVLDIGTIKHIRKGNIGIQNNIDYISGKTIHFINGEKQDFDTIIACIGYCRDFTEIIKVNKSRFEDLKLKAGKQKYFGNDGLYFCGFWIAPLGQIYEIGLDAKKIARHIAKKKRQIRFIKQAPIDLHLQVN